jgi:hypothetical protein
MQVNNYPTLLLYPAGDKTNPVRLLKQMQTCRELFLDHMSVIYVALFFGNADQTLKEIKPEGHDEVHQGKA